LIRNLISIEKEIGTDLKKERKKIALQLRRRRGRII